MSFVIVPNYIAEAIYKKVDEQLAKHPSLILERDNIYRDLLEHFDRTGVIPDFSLEPVTPRQEESVKK